MIAAAEAAGCLRPGMTIVEPTSGNTGIGLAVAAAVKGYRLLLTMPESMSQERRKLLRMLGADFVLTPREKGMQGSVAKAAELCAANADYFMPMQFANPANPEVHLQTTAQEILMVFHQVDAFVAGIGTGGTITGVGQVLKQQRPGVMIVGAEPDDSAILSGEKPGPLGIQGIGAGFVPEILDRDVLDRIIRIKTADAMNRARQLASCEGLLVGISSGAAIEAALQVAAELGAGKIVVVVAPDGGERYLSTDLYKDMD
jgi:cysteine synthase A